MTKSLPTKKWLLRSLTRPSKSVAKVSNEKGESKDSPFFVPATGWEMATV